MTGIVRLDWLRGYRRGWFRADMLAGLTVAAYLIPQVMAYAQVAGLPAIAGLWAALGPLLVYAALGSSRRLSVGPESTTALMTATTVGALAAGDPARYAVLAAGLAVIVGALCIVAWIARLGFLANLLSRPVLVGYLAGIAVIMIVGQLGRVTGIGVEADSVPGELAYTAGHLGQAEQATVIVAAAVLVFLFVIAGLFPRAPGPLIAVVLAAAAVAALDLERRGIAVVGTIPAGLPVPAIPDITPDDLTALLLPAVGVAVVAYSDNVLTARAFASRHHETVDSNAELLALGTANLTAGGLQGFPVSSSGSRTAIADAVGGRTQMYSLIALAAVVATVLFGRPLLASFPTAALGAIVVYAAVRLVDVSEFRRLGRFRRSELVLALLSCAAVLVFDVLYGVLVAIGLSILDLLRRVARPHDGILGYAPGVPGMHDLDDYPDARQVPGLIVYRYDSPLFFANADDFKSRALASLDTATDPVEWFVLNMEANVEVDITAIDALEELRSELSARGIVLALARVKQDLRDVLEAAGFLGRLGPGRVFLTLPTAVADYQKWYVAGHGGTPHLTQERSTTWVPRE